MVTLSAASPARLAVYLHGMLRACLSPDKVILCILLVLIWASSAPPFFIFYSTHSAEFPNRIVTIEENSTGNSCYDDRFYYEESRNYCIPNCHTWRSYSAPVTAGLNAGIIISSCVGTLSAILVIVISVLRRKTVFKFPAILVFYMAISSLIFFAITLVGCIDKRKLYCTSRNLEENLFSPTPYCVFSGIAVNYYLLQLVIWWLLHVASLYFLVFWPLRAKNFMNSKRVHYLHLSAALVGLLIPTFSPLVTLLSGITRDDGQRLGYRVYLYPPHACRSFKRDVQFYTFALPLTFIVTTGVSLLVLIFWKLYKQKLGKKLQLQTAEKKILLSFCYFTLLQIGTASVSTYSGRKVTQHAFQLHDFFACARHSENCEEPALQDVYNPTFEVIACLQACLPIFQLVYVINFEKLKQCVKERSSGQVVI